MKRFSCGDVVPGCKSTFQASTEAELLSQVAAHARQDHGLNEVPAALVEQVRANIHDDASA